MNIDHNLSEISSETCWCAVGKVASELALHVFSPFGEMRVLGDDLFALVREEGTASEGIIVHVAEHDGSNSEISNSDVVSSDVLLAVAKLLFNVMAKVMEVFNILGLCLFVYLLGHLVWVKFGNDIGAVVDHVVGVVGFIVISGGVVAVMLAEEAENCA